MCGETTERAEAEMGALKLSVRIDGEWCPEVRWYTRNLPVFIAEDGTEVDIRDDGSILYESPSGAVEEIEPAAKEAFERRRESVLSKPTIGSFAEGFA